MIILESDRLHVQGNAEGNLATLIADMAGKAQVNGAEYRIENEVYHRGSDWCTLLTCVHYHFNQSIWWYDITSSYWAVRNKYPSATMLGAVNDGGRNVLFIRDNGIVKTVTTKDLGDDFVWTQTSYPLDINTPLPESVLADKERYAAEHPGKPFYALHVVDFPEGHFYGLTFGSELNWTMFYSKAE